MFKNILKLTTIHIKEQNSWKNSNYLLQLNKIHYNSENKFQIILKKSNNPSSNEWNSRGIRHLSPSSLSRSLLFGSSSTSSFSSSPTTTTTTTTENKNDSDEIRTMSDVKNIIMKSLGLEKTYNPLIRPREHLLKYEPKLEDLPPRTMRDSFTTAFIPLSTDTSLRDSYVTFLGHVRLGRLMEDMDLFAVWVCHKHLHIPTLDPNIPLPYTFVTILVDKIDFTDFVAKHDHDIRLSGHVSWVGRSSMEIAVWLEQELNGEWHKLTRALFLMAARNATNTKAAPVNPLKPGTPEEEKIFSGGEQRKKRRIQIQNESLFKTEPNDNEQRLIHDLFLSTINMNFHTLNERHLPAHSKWMESTILSNIIFSQPENRNAHNTVFGGFLMRNALEVSWACAYMHCHHRPKLERICDISFQKPVEMSSFIKMTAHIVYTEMNYMQIMVVAEVFHPKREATTTNVFYYTYSDIEKVIQVFPRTYHEAMWYIDGRRKFRYAMDLV